MVETIVSLFWGAVGIYLAVGLVFAISFALFWSGRLDAVARNGSWGFRLVILPAVAALWPLVAIKTALALQGRYAPPEAERAASAARLRCIHGVAFIVLAVAVPIVCGGALLSRPREIRSTVERLEPVPLPQALSLAESRPGNFPIEASLRTDGTRHQVQLDIAEPLDDPVVAVYWSPKDNKDGVAEDAVFLGTVWGPARLLFSLPDDSQTFPGVLTFIALTGGQRVIATLPLDRK